MTFLPGNGHVMRFARNLGALLEVAPGEEGAHLGSPAPNRRTLPLALLADAAASLAVAAGAGPVAPARAATLLPSGVWRGAVS